MASKDTFVGFVEVCRKNTDSRLFGRSVSLMNESNEDDTVSVEMCFKFNLYVFSDPECLPEGREVRSTIPVTYFGWVCDGLDANWRRKAFHKSSWL